MRATRECGDVRECAGVTAPQVEGKLSNPYLMGENSAPLMEKNGSTNLIPIIDNTPAKKMIPTSTLIISAKNLNSVPDGLMVSIYKPTTSSLHVRCTYVHRCSAYRTSV